jgi:hypothetical protein
MLVRRRFVRYAAFTIAAAGLPAGAMAGEALAPPRGEVVLRVTGAIESTNAPGCADFDIAGLECLGLSRVTTWTPWTKGEIEFEGVLARRLMAAVGAAGTEVGAIALNEYQHTIPIADFESYDVLLAFRMNGRPMRLRDKGPIWIVYPWSDHPELDDFVTRAKSVWQLNALHVQ